MNKAIVVKAVEFEVLGLIRQDSVLNDPEFQQMYRECMEKRKKIM